MDLVIVEVEFGDGAHGEEARGEDAESAVAHVLEQRPVDNGCVEAVVDPAQEPLFVDSFDV